MNIALLDTPMPVVDDTTRRAFVAGSAVLAALLAGCASDPDERAVATPRTPSPSPASAFPVTISHKHGSTTVGAQPIRIVTVGLVEQDALLALGVVPVATTEWFGEAPGAVHPWAQGKLTAAALPTVLTNTDGIAFERIAALRPDLILAIYSDLSAADYATLTAIAPTIAQPAAFVDYGAPWDEVTRTTARALGRIALGDELIAAVKSQFTAARAAHPSFAGASAAFAGYDAGTYYGFAGPDPRGVFLRELGFTNPPALDEIAGTENYFTEVSRERLDVLDVDALIFLIDVVGREQEIASDALFSRLDVAEQGRTLYITDPSELGSAASFQSVLSLPILIAGLIPMLAAALDGDPATRPTAAPGQ